MSSSFVRALRHAARALRRSPGYTATAVLTLALGIGATTAIYSVVSALMLRPLPYPHAERLLVLSNTRAGPAGGAEIDYGGGPREVLRWRQGLRTLEAVEAIYARPIALSGEGTEPETIDGAGATAGYLPLLGADAAFGRSFTGHEDSSAAQLAVLSHGLWRRRFGGDPAILGKSIVLDGRPHVVIGVLRPSFQSLVRRVDVWVPLGLTEASMKAPVSRFHAVLGLARRGVSLAAVTAELRATATELQRDYPASNTGWSARARPAQAAMAEDQRASALTLLGAVAFLLLLGCANVANLTLARAVRRRGETAVRLALGATRWQAARPQLAESALIGLGGAAFGVAVAALAVGPLLALDPDRPPILDSVTLDGRVLAVAVLLSVLAGLASGALPALRAARLGGTAGTLAESGRRLAGGARDRRVRRVLVAAQTALALVLLTGAVLMLRTLRELGRVDPGFDAHNVLTMQLNLPASRYPDKAERAAFVERALETIRAVPGVVGAASTLNRFVPQQSLQTILSIEGRPAGPENDFSTHFRRLSPGYFETMRIPLLRGRTFTAEDREGSVPVAVVSRSLAERAWPGEDALGKRLKRPGDANPWLTVVGVAPDVRDAGLDDELGPTIYLPYAQTNTGTVSLVVRTASAPAGLAPAVRQAVWSLDRDLPLDAVLPLERLMDDSLSKQRSRAVLLSLFAAVGLALASLGLYGVTSHTVAERTREVGIRMALGATGPSVGRLLVLDAMRWVAVGLLVGAALARAAGAAIQGLLFRSSGADPLTLLGAALVLALVALVAAYLPARRAARLVPASALGGE
ncbi:MAG TPA: ABC transporter permease [Gemmatimonadaceae bacterium]|nr:ABC transporter permease [Gemmatimonadaceae bacterium]